MIAEPILTGIGAIITAIAILVTSIAGLIIALGNRARVQEVKKDVQEVHVLVNSQMTEQVKRVDQLIKLLRASGVEIPDVLPTDAEQAVWDANTGT